MDTQALDDETLQQRALAAYYRLESSQGHSSGQAVPSAVSHYITEHLGKQYVVLENFDGVLAVYRVRNDGVLKALRRWPPEIEENRMTYSFIVTADAPGVHSGQITKLSRVLTHSYAGDASADGSRLTARLRIPRDGTVFTMEQAAVAARTYVTTAAGLVGIEDLQNTQVRPR